MSVCVVCLRSLAADFSDVGIQLEAHVFHSRLGWPHRHPGTENAGQRPVLQAHAGACTAALLEHLARIERLGLLPVDPTPCLAYVPSSTVTCASCKGGICSCGGCRCPHAHARCAALPLEAS